MIQHDALQGSLTDLDVTVLMPCLNEAETVATCVTKAKTWLAQSGLRGEVLVADNGSTDGSQQLATEAGARVIAVPTRGYGAALMAGIDEARGGWVIMGDADDSYDFSSLGPFVESLRDGADIVMGNRFAGGIAPGAMPWLHRYIGNPVLSRLGRLFFRVSIRDFHCGLRAGRTDRLRALGLQTPGMEFASEMIARAANADYRITEVPTTLQPDGRSRSPHLRTWSDGWRHLRFMLLFSPAWMFFYPGCALLATGLVATARLAFGDVHLGSVRFSGTSLVGASMVAMVGFQLVMFDVISRVFAINHGYAPRRARIDSIGGRFRLERGLLVGVLLSLLGIVLGLLAVFRWSQAGWGDMQPVEQLRIAVPAGLCLTLGVSVVFSSLLLSSIGMDKRLLFAQSRLGSAAVPDSDPVEQR
jgi:glycosyltransferase involved in cell wall biosynthesis